MDAAHPVRPNGGAPLSQSVWTATATTPEADDPQLKCDIAADVAIIGGGLTGLAAALRLAEGGREVVVLEAAKIGFGASGRNGGQVNPGLKLGEADVVRRLGKAGRALVHMGEEATDFLAGLIAAKGLRCGFIRPGLVRLAHSEPALKRLAAEEGALGARGIAARLLSGSQVEAIVGTRRYRGGLIDPRGGSLHPLDLVRELARIAREAGARIFVHSPARRIEQAGSGWRIACSEGSVAAREVIVATNAYTDHLVPRLAQSLVPVHSLQIATAPLTEPASRAILPGGHAAYDSRRLLLYFRRAPDGGVMLGGRGPLSPEAAARAEDFRHLERVLVNVFPQLKGVAIVHRWSGLVCVTPDALPHYHQPAAGLHVLLGYNGRGVAMAVRAGTWLAETMRGISGDAAIPATPIRPIPLHRFRAPAVNLAIAWNRLLDRVGW